MNIWTTTSMSLLSGSTVVPRVLEANSSTDWSSRPHKSSRWRIKTWSSTREGEKNHTTRYRGYWSQGDTPKIVISCHPVMKFRHF